MLFYCKNASILSTSRKKVSMPAYLSKRSSASLPSFLRFAAALCLAFSLCMTSLHPALAAAFSDKKTVTQTQKSSSSLACPKAASSVTKTVSTSLGRISGKDSLNGGRITGSYTGTKKTVVTDAFTKGKSSKKRTTTVTSIKNYRLELSEDTKNKLFGQLDKKIKKAWDQLHFTFAVNTLNGPRIHTYSTKNRQIQLSSSFEYQELLFMMGYFVSFAAGNAALGSSFQAIYLAEKNAFKGWNSAFVCQSPYTFFAGCFRDYVQDKARLTACCPKAAAFIASSIGRLNDSQIRLASQALR